MKTVTDIERANELAIRFNLDVVKTREAVEKWGYTACLKTCLVGEKPYKAEQPRKKIARNSSKKKANKTKKLSRRGNRK